MQRDKKRRARFVTAYVVTLEYGGPEEGGWNWNRREPVECRRDVPEHRIDQVRAEMRNRLMNEHVDRDPRGRFREFSSVLGGVGVAVYIEERYGENAKLNTPRYE